jgi:dolichyl-phosphate beta-glucosyltransferase
MATDGVSVSIVIPAFNEESRIGGTLDDLTSYLSTRPWAWEIRVVDDGSSDATAATVDGYAARDRRIVLQRSRIGGKVERSRLACWRPLPGSDSSAMPTCRCR